MPRSREMKASNESCEPFSTETRHALFHSSNCSEVASAFCAKRFLIDTNAMLFSHLQTSQSRKSCAPGQRIWNSFSALRHHTSLKASSSTASMKSASARVRHIGGLMRRVLPQYPPL